MMPANLNPPRCKASRLAGAHQIPHSFRYQVTSTGHQQALFLTRLSQRLIIPGLAQLTDSSPPAPTRLRAAARAYDTAIDELTRQARLAA